MGHKNQLSGKNRRREWAFGTLPRWTKRNNRSCYFTSVFYQIYIIYIKKCLPVRDVSDAGGRPAAAEAGSERSLTFTLCRVHSADVTTRRTLLHICMFSLAKCRTPPAARAGGSPAAGRRSLIVHENRTCKQTRDQLQSAVCTHGTRGSAGPDRRESSGPDRVARAFQSDVIARNHPNVPMEVLTSNLAWDIITGDTAWIYCYDPKIKQLLTEWVYRGETKPSKVARERRVPLSG
ncbi:hypothetical protein EVAR_4484_1 [Eumeta japonica]|uniref:Uncharacterized protein n=1 Tax=Eumeta variegata TaxID=151549 RepID=A0A4C1SYU8_EUMVA|nr:hypothetical protein EVAR_4484_1 [Eumeta japonica]